MNAVAVGGSPASGKTTLFRELMSATGGPLRWWRQKRGLVVYHEHSKSKAIILGDYSSDGTFAGTDKLSMAVQKEAIAFVKMLSAGDACPAILFEGDRLYNNSFLGALEETIPGGLTVVELFAGEDVLKARHAARGDTQTEKWLAGRATKLANVRRGRHVERRPNAGREQLLANVDYLLERAGLLFPAAAKNKVP